jgi:hypothetical protein
LVLIRRLHQAVPRVAITIVTHTTGTFAGHFVVAHPEQEVVLRHQYLADSLGVPGALCVTTTHYHMTPEGHAIPTPDVNAEAYHTGGGLMIVISPMGTTLNNGIANFVDSENFEWYLKRLAEKYSIGALSNPGQP